MGLKPWSTRTDDDEFDPEEQRRRQRERQRQRRARRSRDRERREQQQRRHREEEPDTNANRNASSSGETAPMGSLDKLGNAGKSGGDDGSNSTAAAAGGGGGGGGENNVTEQQTRVGGGAISTRKLTPVTPAAPRWNPFASALDVTVPVNGFQVELVRRGFFGSIVGGTCGGFLGILEGLRSQGSGTKEERTVRAVRHLYAKDKFLLKEDGQNLKLPKAGAPKVSASEAMGPGFSDYGHIAKGFGRVVAHEPQALVSVAKTTAVHFGAFGGFYACYWSLLDVVKAMRADDPAGKKRRNKNLPPDPMASVIAALPCCVVFASISPVFRANFMWAGALVGMDVFREWQEADGVEFD